MTLCCLSSVLKSVIITCLFLSAFNILNAQQQKNIKGIISDNENSPLTGATVQVKNSSRAAVTAANGSFSIKAAKGETLVISSVNFTTKEFLLEDDENVSLQLEGNVANLSDVVVVGYGKQKKINVTGAVGSVSNEFLKDRPITNVTQALQGGVSGVSVNQNSGQAGADGASIRIRGIGTLNNTNPLILVDGIEAPIDNIDPNDIASISVLKDAASASIYGSRAANGVLLVTTKRGKTDTKPAISYSGYAGSTEATILPDLVTNSVDFMTLRNEADVNAGNLASFTQSEIDRYKTIGPNTDWVNSIFKNGNIQNHNVSVNGGGANTSYLFSVGYLNQKGITPNENYKRYNLRLNLDSKIGNKFAFGTSLFLTRGEQLAPLGDLVQTGAGNGIIARVLGSAPLYPAFTSTGEVATGDQSFASYNPLFLNPFEYTVFNSYTGLRNQLLASGFGEYEIINGLKVKGTFAVNYQANDGQSFGERHLTYDWVTNLPLLPAVIASRSLSHGQSLNLTTWLQTTYEKVINQHKFSVLAGYNQESSRSTGFGAGRIRFPSNSVRVLGAADPTTATNYEYATEWALRSYFGRINYNYDGKYLLEANVRRDGSSRFGANNTYGTFPSVSAGWVVSNEPFFKSLRVINYFKLRGSWGQLGNQYAQGTNYPFAAQVSVNSNYVFNGTLVPGAAQTTFENDDIKWESTTSTDVGVEFGLGNKITIESDYFVRTAKDILFALPVPATAGGLQNPIVNTARVQNKGWEFATNYKDRFGAFTFQLGLNVTNVNSKVLEIDQEASGNSDRVISGNKIIQRGSPINSIYGLQAIGIFQSEDEIAKSPTQFGNYGPGDLKYADLDGNGSIDDDDRTIIGREDPRWIYGATLNVGFKGIDLSAVVSGVSNIQGYGSAEFYEPFFNGSALGTQWLNRWTPQNPSNWPRLYYGSGPNFTRANSFWLLDRSFLRLKNIQLGYTLPKSVLQKIKIKSIRVYVNGQNLFTSTDFFAFDPERVEGAYRGADSYPLLKIITGGLNINF